MYILFIFLVPIAFVFSLYFFYKWVICINITFRKKVSIIIIQLLIILVIEYGVPIFLPNPHPYSFDHQSWRGLEITFAKLYCYGLNIIFACFYLYKKTSNKK